ncbi:MAG: carbohydrate ABC transporter permease, partial [Oscillospiraceae bacterium]|nr:carbohydrate ABC transporter permease [Oscillospiraceae bacterium]
MIIVSLVSVFPLYWMAVSSTNKSVDVIHGTLLPGSYFIENWKALLAAQNVSRAFINSFRNSIC